MNGLELNKIAAAVLLAGIIALVVGFVTDALYHPELQPEKRGYTIAGAEEADSAGSTAEAAPSGPVDIAEYMAAADAAKGQVVAKKCAVCHDFTKGGPDKTGPNLWNVLGAPKAHSAGYAYTDAFKALGGKWTYQELSEFLTAPSKYVKGTKMAAFMGLKKPEDRADVIAYLRSLSDSPIALPPAPAKPAEAEAPAEAAPEAAAAAE